MARVYAAAPAPGWAPLTISLIYTIRYIYVRSKAERNGQLTLAHGTETKQIKEKLETKTD